MQDIITGKGDLGADMTLLPERGKVVDSSLGYLLDGYNVLTKLKKNEISNKGN